MIQLLFILIAGGLSKSRYVEGFTCTHISQKRFSNSHQATIPPGTQRKNTLNMMPMVMDPADIVSSVNDLSSLYPMSSLLIAEATEEWVRPLSNVLDPLLNFMSFAMLARVVLSWYPEANVKTMTWTIAVTLPTDPLLRIVKGIIPEAFGVDITPVFWLAIFTFIHEILLGQQGLLTMKMKYGV